LVALCKGRRPERPRPRRAARLIAFVVASFGSTVMASAGDLPLRPLSFEELEGWRADDHEAAFQAFRRSCREIVNTGTGFTRKPLYAGERQDWRGVCALAEAADRPPARRFFESEFLAFAVADPERPQGLFTGYFEPEVIGSRSQGGRYQAPLYRRPPDLVAFDASAREKSGLTYGRLVKGEPTAYHTRKEIENGALAGKGLEVVWLTDWADAFFLQVQGSGRVRLADGTVLRLGFDGKTGLPYTAIGGILAKRGDIPPEQVSMQSIRAWMAKDPKAARELMWENESFVFFRELPAANPAEGPPGAQKVPLTPRRSLAIDRAYWAFGTPMWIEADVPSGPGGALEPFRRLLIAQDTGTAIKGRVRGDVFWGAGEAAAVAGPMKSPGRMVALLPKAVAARLGLAGR
jgi:membrane-bound lytic murein transglycosylase A